MMNKYSLMLNAFALVQVVLAGQARADQDCAGELAQGHTPKTFDFQTQSRVIQIGEKEFEYRTCIINESDEDLRSYWYIPGNVNWTPPGQTTVDPRFYSVEPEGIEKSCIEYGNVGDTTGANFHATSTEIEQARKEKEEGCDAGGAYDISQANDNQSRDANVSDTIEMENITEISTFFNLYFPHDLESPSETFLQMVGRVGIKKRENNVVSFVSYDIKSFRGVFPTNINRIKITFSTEGLHNTHLLSSIEESGNNFPLDQSGGLEFSYRVGESASLGSVRARIINEDDVLIGGFFVPIYTN